MNIIPFYLDKFVSCHKEIRKKELYDGSFLYSYMVGFPNTFDNPYGLECRGLIVSKDGVVLRRPLIKYFNVNEKVYLQANLLNKKTISSVYEKVDGSMIAPWIDSFDNINFDTKNINLEMRKSINAYIPNQLKIKTRKYILENRLQLIFELYHPDIIETNIVIEYNEPILRLLAVRYMDDGAYVSQETTDIIAKDLNVKRPKQFKELEKLSTTELVIKIKKSIGAEGIVINYTDESMVKIKCDWYLLRHKAIDAFKFEHNIAKLILSSKPIDDLSSLLSIEKLKKYENSSATLYAKVEKLQTYIEHISQKFSSRSDMAMSKYATCKFAYIIFKRIDSTDNDLFEIIVQDLKFRWINKKNKFQEWNDLIDDLIIS